MFSYQNIKSGIYVIIIIILSFLTAFLCKTGFILIATMIIILLFCLYKPTLFSVNYFIICTVFQNITLIICAPYINSTETSMIIILKELVIYGVAAIYFLKYRLMNMNKRDYLFVAFCILALLNLLSADSLSLAIVSLRQIMVIFMCYYFGKAIKINNENHVKIIFDSILFYCFLVCILGIILYFFSDEMWLKMGFAEYWENKTGGNTRYNFVNFYTYDLGPRLKRIVSIFADPLAYVHFIGIGFITLFYIYKKIYIFFKVIMVICLIMGISKGSAVLIISAVLVLNYSKIKSKSVRNLFIIICMLFGSIFLSKLSDYSSGLTQATSAGNHFNAFIYGIQNATLLGKGLGTIGYNASIMGLDGYDTGYNESFFALCIGQIGIVGTILIYVFMFSCIFSNYALYKKTKNKYIFISIILIFSILVESLFSASSISMLGTGLYFILAGLCNNISLNNVPLGGIENENIDDRPDCQGKL